MRIDSPVGSLAPFVIDQPSKDETLAVVEASTLLNTSRPTIYSWIDRGTLLAWPSTKRGFVIPAEQIVGLGKLVAGLPRILEIPEIPNSPGCS